jgi:hypothetical protein
MINAFRVGERTNRRHDEQTIFSYQGSIKMYSMHEALARDRMRDQERRSREARLARELAAERRWHRVSLHARAAQARHARRVSRVPVR